MPSSFVFRNLGLFVDTNFFDLQTCRKIQDQMCFAQTEKATVATASGRVLDEDIRKVLSANVDISVSRMVSDALQRLKPDLERHFNIALRKAELPFFLRYREGAYYRPHQDGSPNSPPTTRHRRVSAVIFLNSRSNEPAPDCYGGGALAFYGLVKGPQWEKLPLPLDSEPGLLIAFRSDTLHEVQPITFGQRFTIATWFA